MKEWEGQFEKNMLEASQVFHLIDQAITEKKSFSLARFGIGEISYLRWPENTWMIHQFKRYEKYAGVSSGYGKIKKELVASLKQSDIIGVISPHRLEFFGKQMKAVFQQLTFNPARCCSAWVFQDYIKQQSIWPWLKAKKMLLIGRRAKEAYDVFVKRGINVVGTIEINSDLEIEKVVNDVTSIDHWDVALISAGIPATILAPKIAVASNRVAIDFGHSLDLLIDGEEFDHWKKVDEWNRDYSE